MALKKKAKMKRILFTFMCTRFLKFLQMLKHAFYGHFTGAEENMFSKRKLKTNVHRKVEALVNQINMN